MARLIPLVKAWPRLQSSLVRRLLSLPPPLPPPPFPVSSPSDFCRGVRFCLLHLGPASMSKGMV